MVPQVVSNDPRPHHVHPDQPLDLLLARCNMWLVLTVFILIPVALMVFWWPHSTQGTASAGCFPIVKQHSALAGSLCLVALQVFPGLQQKRGYLLILPVILSANIAEAVVGDFQCYGIHGVDWDLCVERQGTRARLG